MIKIRLARLGAKKKHQILVGFAAETEHVIKYGQDKVIEKTCIAKLTANRHRHSVVDQRRQRRAKHSHQSSGASASSNRGGRLPINRGVLDHRTPTTVARKEPGSAERGQRFGHGRRNRLHHTKQTVVVVRFGQQHPQPQVGDRRTPTKWTAAVVVVLVVLR